MTRLILALSERRQTMQELENQLLPEAYRVEILSLDPAELLRFDPDLVLLDLPRPEQDALALYRSVPRMGAAPLLLLTASYTDQLVSAALEAGVDGCLPIATSPHELAAWVRALLRRRATPVAPRSERLQLGALTIDLAQGRVEKRGAPLWLPPTQMLLLRTLAQRLGQVVPREHLLTQVLGPQARRKLTTLHVHMFTLRTIIEDDPRQPRYLRTIRGVGYVLNAEPGGTSPEGARPALIE